jgi:hypothetical protein
LFEGCTSTQTRRTFWAISEGTITTAEMTLLLATQKELGFNGLDRTPREKTQSIFEMVREQGEE